MFISPRPHEALSRKTFDRSTPYTVMEINVAQQDNGFLFTPDDVYDVVCEMMESILGQSYREEIYSKVVNAVCSEIAEQLNECFISYCDDCIRSECQYAIVSMLNKAVMSE